MDKEIKKECKKHGTTDYVLEGSGYYRCKKCRSAAVSRKRQNLKKKAVAYKGGKCERCEYDRCPEAMDFHHRDSTDKDFGISAKGFTRSFEKMKVELDKCMLLCSNCHREYHAGLWEVS